MRIRVRVKPRSKREGVKVLEESLLEVRVKEPPEGGRANERVRELLAEHLGVPKSRIKIVRGFASKEKVVEVEL